MFVEALFWFHPLVWWIGKRMVEERERACDEEVLRMLGEPQPYAEGILNVCKLYTESVDLRVRGNRGGFKEKNRGHHEESGSEPGKFPTQGALRDLQHRGN